METETKKLQAAAYNNAVWCETVCRSHNVPGEFHETFWVNGHRTPVYYPNLVTLSPTAHLDPHQRALAALFTERKDYPVSVKDSFAVLDLTPLGFQQLFQAQWLFRPASAARPQQGMADLQWERIVSEEGLLRWEEAWSHGALSGHRLFLPALLHDADICIVAASKGGQIIAGAIANKTTGVVGLSNVFTPEREAERFWEGLLDTIAVCYPTLPVVGYERDESLTVALRVGFTPLGSLRVWIKKEDRPTLLKEQSHEPFQLTISSPFKPV